MCVILFTLILQFCLYLTVDWSTYVIELHNKCFCKEYMYCNFLINYNQMTDFRWFFWKEIRIWNSNVSWEISTVKIINKELILCMHWTFVNLVLYIYFLILSDGINKHVQLPARRLLVYLIWLLIKKQTKNQAFWVFCISNT